ncbi:hypothetical protein GCM10009846_29690 [Agrococcus versicolor]|uniref:Uncharacterized protein n=1 Tax=Agrococcus versicolor TaxID=501482 RepID=A0ABP5MSM6_9MICO
MTAGSMGARGVKSGISSMLGSLDDASAAASLLSTAILRDVADGGQCCWERYGGIDPEARVRVRPPAASVLATRT